MYITVYVFDTVSRLLLSMGTAKLDHPFSGYQRTTTGTTTQLAVSPAHSASCWRATLNVATAFSIGVTMTATAPSSPSLVKSSFFLPSQLSLLSSITCFSLLPLPSFTVFPFSPVSPFSLFLHPLIHSPSSYAFSSSLSFSLAVPFVPRRAQPGLVVRMEGDIWLLQLCPHVREGTRRTHTQVFHQGGPQAYNACDRKGSLLREYYEQQD